MKAFGRLDVLVNNAGYANVNSIEDFDEDDFRAQIETNLWGVINLTRAALPVLREQGAGHIIQISSVGGRVTSPGIGPYQTAKWAVEGFSGVLAKEVAPLGIKVTIIEPGGFRTDWAGASMTVHAIRDAYQPTVGRCRYRERGRRSATRSRARGDPGDRPGPRAAAAAAARRRRVRGRARGRRGEDRLRRGLEGPDVLHRRLMIGPSSRPMDPLRLVDQLDDLIHNAKPFR